MRSTSYSTLAKGWGHHCGFLGPILKIISLLSVETFLVLDTKNLIRSTVMTEELRYEEDQKLWGELGYQSKEHWTRIREVAWHNNSKWLGLLKRRRLQMSTSCWLSKISSHSTLDVHEYTRYRLLLISTKITYFIKSRHKNRNSLKDMKSNKMKISKNDWN